MEVSRWHQGQFHGPPRPSYRNRSRTKDMRLLEGDKAVQDCPFGQNNPVAYRRQAFNDRAALGGWAKPSLLVSMFRLSGHLMPVLA